MISLKWWCKNRALECVWSYVPRMVASLIVGLLLGTACKALVSPSIDLDPSLSQVKDSLNFEDDPLPGIHNPYGWHQLPIRYHISQYDFPVESHDQIRRAIKTWEQAARRPLFTEIELSEPPYSPTPMMGLRDQILEFRSLDDWAPQEVRSKLSSGYATTFYLNSPEERASGEKVYRIYSADIWFNSPMFLWGDITNMPPARGQKTNMDLQSTALHELGHVLGLSHVQPADEPDSIMVSYYVRPNEEELQPGSSQTAQYIRIPSVGDIERLQQIYPCDPRIDTAHVGAQEGGELGRSCEPELIYAELRTELNAEVNSGSGTEPRHGEFSGG